METTHTFDKSSFTCVKQSDKITDIVVALGLEDTPNAVKVSIEELFFDGDEDTIVSATESEACDRFIINAIMLLTNVSNKTVGEVIKPFDMLPKYRKVFQDIAKITENIPTSDDLDEMFEVG